MYDLINKNVCKNGDFTQHEIDYFNSILQNKTVAKKTLLLQDGEVCNFEAYILKGCIRKFYIDEHGHEVILQFAVEDWWVSDIASFHEKKPSKLFIETLEDCELLLLTPETKEKLLVEIPKFERIFRLLVQRNLSSMQNRLIGTIAKTAQEKYLEFIKLYPTISQRVAQHHIASYLGMTAEFLSKTRTKLAKQ
ncbi:Crp/Fnr family transcriptional regulator [Flavobacterium aquatile]|uniref:Crp/Fnr family transcriptional regulator n=1 Tax=Flavobacterium aquatile LMG 4008 = ATCC 11947 TaxID=1453498 RepID=A0A095TX74_9FLAO|nr:Crp/Fnr family transcriptional regulator [Flavobacterium aquatile]KGD66978.1 Crp/Fnr family transcriptional regulator [Flavobacterium aquatile LMG 4008 = ATCC 11947]OXA68073.1 Crp/Fnr family transcriptional regulator [Flavobacterium aquatile LMG 4008 = ATCC 11947]GEC80178.1 cyclic nucleotide-binding protein [Flavobacterium aquatile]